MDVGPVEDNFTVAILARARYFRIFTLHPRSAQNTDTITSVPKSPRNSTAYLRGQTVVRQLHAVGLQHRERVDPTDSVAPKPGQADFRHGH